MLTTTIQKRLLVAALFVMVLASPGKVSAQLTGHNLRGDMGLKSGSQAPAGLYFAIPLVRFDADSIRGTDGKVLATGDFDLGAGIPLIQVVTKKKILGANYGFMIAQPLMNTQVGFPRFDGETGFGFGDTYVVPLSLGWHTPRADYIAAYGFYAPTGGENQSLDMWSHELSLGSTVFFDEGRNWHLATTGFYEMHTKKSNADLQVGNLLTLEGGVGRSFMKQAASIGLAYTAQWKVSNDSGADFPEQLVRGKNRAFSVGPEINMPFFAKNQWVGLLGFRYLFDVGVNSAFQGDTIMFTLTLARFSK